MMQNVDDDAGTPSTTRLLAALLGAPVVWTLHLFVSYAVVAVDCATGWSGGRIAVVLATVVALFVTAACGLLARRLWERSRAVDHPTDDHWDARMGERTARVSFLMVSGLVLAVLFGIAILYAGLPVIFLATCPPATPA